MFLIASVCCITPAAAQVSSDVVAEVGSASSAPEASVRTFGRTSNAATWHGRGPRTFRTTLCVGSTTGRFRLAVRRDASSPLDLSIVFSDASGAQQTASTNTAIALFDGIDPNRGDCTRGANAWIEFSIDEATLLANTAGEYLDAISLTAEPL